MDNSEIGWNMGILISKKFCESCRRHLCVGYAMTYGRDLYARPLEQILKECLHFHAFKDRFIHGRNKNQQLSANI